MEYYDPGFGGTERWYRHPLGILYVDSVRYVCREKECYWILDVIGSYMFQQPFLILQFDVEDSRCRFSAKEDRDEKEIAVQHIPFTTLDVSLRLYLEGGVVIFPSDH